MSRDAVFLHSRADHYPVPCSVYGTQHILYLFVADSIFEAETRLEWPQHSRALAGELLCKLAADAVHGAHVSSIVCRLMPEIFLSTLAEDPVGTVRVFDTDHRNPELI
eukprot:6200572-Pleurochrysis_carterae.AAC.3